MKCIALLLILSTVVLTGCVAEGYSHERGYGGSTTYYPPQPVFRPVVPVRPLINRDNRRWENERDEHRHFVQPPVRPNVGREPRVLAPMTRPIRPNVGRERHGGRD